MTDREIVVYLAEKVMGWVESDGGSSSFPIFRFCQGGIYPSGWRVFDHRLHCGRDWNPLENIADAFEVQAALPDDKRDDFSKALWQIFADEKTPWRSKFEGYWHFSNATARQRCLAILEVTK